MSGITSLQTLLANLQPSLAAEEFVFISRPHAQYGDGAELNPVAVIAEDEGLTLIVPKRRADAAGENYCGVFHKITLQVHSSLVAAGLTATVAGALSQRGISVNVVAAFYHDHLFVPAPQATGAMEVLAALSASAGSVAKETENE